MLTVKLPFDPKICLLAAVLPLAAQAASHVPDTGTCTIPPDWATGSLPSPVDTAASMDFDTNCAFHMWSWNAFLWSMEEVNGAPRFEGFPTLEQVIDQSWDSAAPAMAADVVQLSLRPGKSDHPIDGVAQAGTTGILVTPNKRAVYYSQYVSPQMYDDIQTNTWFTAAGISGAPDDVMFEVGNIEYKAAWAIVDDTYKVPGAYTRRASIPRVANLTVNGVTTIGVPSDPTYEEVDVALIGFHVVGWVNGHAEAIWASFAPHDLAPVVAQPAPDTSTVVSGSATPFYKAGSVLGDCNQTAVPVQTLDEASQTFSLATVVCQSYQSGTVLTGTAEVMQSSLRNIHNIDVINASAMAVLPQGALARGYTEVGAVWSVSDYRAYCDSLPDAQKPPNCSGSDVPTSLEDASQISGKVGTTFQDNLQGSTVLSNPVIETFTQTDRAQDNCFSCHNSIQYQPADQSLAPLKATMLNLSHIILQIYVADLQSGN